MQTVRRSFLAWPRLRVWVLFFAFVALWISLWLLNRPEQMYADQPLSYWLERMAHESTAAQASTVVSEMGPEAVPALIDALRTRSSTVGDNLHAMAVRLRLAPPRSYDAANIRATAAFLLGRIGEDAWPAIAELVRALGDEDAVVRFRASRALGRIGRVAVPELTGALHSPEPVVRYGAAKALAGMGPKARSAVAELKLALNDPQENVRTAAQQALAAIGK